MEAAVKQVHLVSKNKFMEVKTEMKGTVKFFNASKGFGFIAADDGKEYFVHVSALPEGVTLNENDPVEFDVEEGDRGPKAVNVKKSE
jgi:CspA family cold shock protein